MGKGILVGLAAVWAAGGAWAQPAAQLVLGPNGSAVGHPAARSHVKLVNGAALKCTSKLARVVELNFTFGNSHLDGKKVITAGLDRIAKSYAIGGKDAFTVRKFTSTGTGSAEGEMVDFTLADLVAGEVIVTNNISKFNELQARSASQAAAFEAAVKVEGRGVLGFHGSGDGGAGWKFYSDELHPVSYNGHAKRVEGTVYKHSPNARHVILQNILESGTALADVPMGVDAGGKDVIEKGVKTRRMLNEWYFYGRNLTTDAKYAPLVTPLLKYDPRDLAGALEPQYRYAGGNLYTFLLRVGAGKVAYVPAGHADDELMATGTTFDGGTGDFDRYVAQTLFYLAGYRTEVCKGNSCDGLPLVDAADRLVGEIYVDSTAVFARDRMAFSNPFGGPYEARLVDVAGKVVAAERGSGKAEHAFEEAALKPGIYFMSVRVGKAPAKLRRYVVALGR